MWSWVRIPKAIALLCFFLPWLTVSCSGQHLVRASGFQLASGTAQVLNPLNGNVQQQGGDPNLWLLLALVVVAAGLIFSMIGKRGMSRMTLATSLFALLLLFAGMARYTHDALLRDARTRGDAPFGNGDLSMMFQVEWNGGFWLCVLALVAAAALSFLAYSGRSIASFMPSGAGGGAVPSPAPAETPAAPPEPVMETAPEAAAPTESLTPPEAETPADAIEATTRTCPVCGKHYGPEILYCPADGTKLA